MIKSFHYLMCKEEIDTMIHLKSHARFDIIFFFDKVVISKNTFFKGRIH